MPASARSSESILVAHFESDGQRRSEQFRRSDLKDESQPLISNLTTLCHPPSKPSGSPLSETSLKHPLPEPFQKMTRVPECRTREHFPGCRASAPRVPQLKPRPYPEDFPTTLRVPSERDTCPECPRQLRPSGSHPNLPPVPSAFRTRHLSRVPPAVKTLRKPPELTTRSECLNSKLPPGALRVATCPETHPGRIPNASRKPRLHHVYRAADLPDAAGQPANHPGRPSRTLGECAACRPSRERNSRK